MALKVATEKDFLNIAAFLKRFCFNNVLAVTFSKINPVSFFVP